MRAPVVFLFWAFFLKFFLHLKKQFTYILWEFEKYILSIYGTITPPVFIQGRGSTGSLMTSHTFILINLFFLLQTFLRSMFYDYYFYHYYLFFKTWKYLTGEVMIASVWITSGREWRWVKLPVSRLEHEHRNLSLFKNNKKKSGGKTLKLNSEWLFVCLLHCRKIYFLTNFAYFCPCIWYFWGFSQAHKTLKHFLKVFLSYAVFKDQHKW